LRGKSNGLKGGGALFIQASNKNLILHFENNSFAFNQLLNGYGGAGCFDGILTLNFTGNFFYRNNAT
jgi:hypothetical protein